MHISMLYTKNLYLKVKKIIKINTGLVLLLVKLLRGSRHVIVTVYNKR